MKKFFDFLKKIRNYLVANPIFISFSYFGMKVAIALYNC